MNVAHIPCNTGTARTEIPTLMGQTIHTDACTTWGIGLGVHPDTGERGYSTQLSVGQARDLATALTAASDAIERAVTVETPEMTKAALPQGRFRPHQSTRTE